MTQRARIFLAAVVLVVLPVAVLAVWSRARLQAAAETEFLRRAHGDIVATLDAPIREAADVRARLQALAAAAADDNRLRWALVDGRMEERAYLRDYAGRVAGLMGLDVLQLMDAQGRILSSAHYRNEFGRQEPGLIGALGDPDVDLGGALDSPELQRPWPRQARRFTDPAAAFVLDRDPGGPLLALLVRQDLSLGGRTFHWVGGRRVVALGSGRARGAVVTADTALASGLPVDVADRDRPGAWHAWGRRHGLVWQARAVPVADPQRKQSALLVAAVDRGPLQDQRARLDQTWLATVAAAVAGALALAAWLAARLARPLAELAHRAARIDLDDPRARFPAGGRDEVGRLSGVLGAMVDRLRQSARRLADAERRATLGEVARQVNHDLRNGITPVRNVVRHLDQTAARDPVALAGVWRDRHGTLVRSLDYLEDLAGRYARLAPPRRREPCDVGAIAGEAAAGDPRITVTAAPDTPPVLTDPVSLRRILDNLLRNALEALPDGRGTVVVSVAAAGDADTGAAAAGSPAITGTVVRIRDDGEGMSPEVRDRVGEDFFTTRPGGTGLGLSNVRRLVGDAGGQLDIASEPGRGTTVTILFPGCEDAP